MASHRQQMNRLKFRPLVHQTSNQTKSAQFDKLANSHSQAPGGCPGGYASGAVEIGKWSTAAVKEIVCRMRELAFSENTPSLHHRVIRLSIDSDYSVQLRQLVMGSFCLVVHLMRVKAIADSTRISVCIWVSPAAAEIVASSIKRVLPSTHFDQRDSRIETQGRQP